MAVREQKTERLERTKEPGQALVIAPEPIIVAAARSAGGLVPRLIAAEGESASLRFLDFFTANIRNPNTRAAYSVAARAFFAWLDAKKVPALGAVRTHHVSAYVELLGRAYKTSTVKQHLAAIRMLFDWLIVGQVVPTNPAAAVRGPKHVVKKGKTPVLDGDEAKKLIDSIDASTVVGLRDRALIALLVYNHRARLGGAAIERRGLLSAGQALVGVAARKGRQAARDAGAPPARTLPRRLRGRRRHWGGQDIAFVPHARWAWTQAALARAHGAAGL